MTTLLLLLTLLTPLEDSEQLQAHYKISNLRGFEESQIEVFGGVYPKTLVVGDLVYIVVEVKNISQEPLEYCPAVEYLGQNIRFVRGFAVQNGSVSTDWHRGDSESIGLSDSPPVFEEGHWIAVSYGIKTLLPGDSMVCGPQSVFVPTPNNFDKPFWSWEEVGKAEKKRLRFGTSLINTNRRPGAPYLFTEIHGIAITQELIFHPRPNAELQLIKEWFEKTGARNWWRIWNADSSTAADWREFEEKLTPGTLRNFIRVHRTLVEIGQDESKGKRQAMFDEMLAWINELHPLEKEGLTKRAYELITPVVRVRIFENEIAVPEK